MKTASLTYPSYRFIDLAPLAARYEVLTRAVLTYLAAGQMRAMMRCTQKVLRLVRVYARLDSTNTLWARKLEMLSDKNWRDRVLRDLGGLRKLALWEAARDRVLARNGTPVGPSYPSTVAEPSWVRTPERIAESERLKAHARKCARAGAAQQPNVYRDRVKMDFDGLFRLPPMPRAKRTEARKPKVYTQNSIVEYQFNAVPFAESVGLGPAMVWPVEFYAAMGIEAREQNSQTCHPNADEVRLGPMPESLAQIQSGYVPKYQGMGPGLCLINQTQGRDDKERRAREPIPARPLHVALPPAVYRDLFETPI